MKILFAPTLYDSNAYKSNNYGIKNSYCVKKTSFLMQDSVSFCSKSTPSHSFKDFQQKYHKKYSIPLEDLAPIIMTDRNIIGEGHCKKVYKIPGISDYVLAQIKNKYIYQPPNSFHKPFVASDNLFANHNFGQPLAQNNAGLYILGKVTGTAHSLPNWVKRYETRSAGIDITSEEATLFLKNLKKLNDLPQKSFTEFAEKIKVLNDVNMKFDSINPNNILIDLKQKKINIVDVDKPKKVPQNFTKPYNTVNDMINVFLDSFMFASFYEKLNGKQKSEMIKYSNQIIEKCLIAGKNTGLLQDEQKILHFIKFVDELMINRDGYNREFAKRYNDFLNILRNNKV